MDAYLYASIILLLPLLKCVYACVIHEGRVYEERDASLSSITLLIHPLVFLPIQGEFAHRICRFYFFQSAYEFRPS